MRKHKILTNVLSLSALLVATSSAFAAISCGNGIDDLFFNIDTDYLDVVFCDKGASIYSIKYKDRIITYCPKDKKEFLRDDFYYGKALGRVTGRIPDGKLKVDGQDYQLEVNEVTDTKNNSLHGGTHSFTSKIFSHKIKQTDNAYEVTFHAISPDGEAGYPGEVDAYYIYTIYRHEAKMDLNIKATTTAKTPLNLSTHPFFNLSDYPKVTNHSLTIPAEWMGEYKRPWNETDQTVVGEILVGGTPWDFKQAKEIGNDIFEAQRQDPISGGYDHIWKFDQGGGSNFNTIKLTHPYNDTKLTVTTDADAVIMYANCFEHEGLIMTDGQADRQYAAITIEPYKFFTTTTVDDLLIDKGQEFTRYISYQLESVG